MPLSRETPNRAGSDGVREGLDFQGGFPTGSLEVNVPNIRLLVLLTILVVVAVVGAIMNIDANNLSGYGSIIAAGSGLLAVIWFTASLWYQSRQLKEQRTQFLAQFQHQQESSRRDSLLTAKNILDAAEERAISHHGGISSSSDLLTQYLNFAELKPILESDNPDVVLSELSRYVVLVLTRQWEDDKMAL